MPRATTCDSVAPAYTKAWPVSRDRLSVELMRADVGSTRGSRKHKTSINALRTSVRCFFGYLHSTGLIAHNPTRLLRMAKATPSPPHPIYEGDLQLLLEWATRADTHAGRRDHALLVLLSGSVMHLGTAVDSPSALR